VATGQVLFLRYAISWGMKVTDLRSLVCVCLFLACKVIEKPIALNAICKAYFRLNREEQMRKNPKLQIPPLSRTMRAKLRDRFISLESDVLCTLNFDVEVDLPYTIINNFKEELARNAKWPTHDIEPFMRAAYSYCNDSFMTTASLIKPAEEIAIACLALAARYYNINLDLPPVDAEVFEMINGLYNVSN